MAQTTDQFPPHMPLSSDRPPEPKDPWSTPPHLVNALEHTWNERQAAEAAAREEITDALLGISNRFAKKLATHSNAEALRQSLHKLAQAQGLSPEQWAEIERQIPTGRISWPTVRGVVVQHGILRDAELSVLDRAAWDTRLDPMHPANAAVVAECLAEAARSRSLAAGRPVAHPSPASRAVGFAAWKSELWEAQRAEAQRREAIELRSDPIDPLRDLVRALPRELLSPQSLGETMNIGRWQPHAPSHVTPSDVQHMATPIADIVSRMIAATIEEVAKTICPHVHPIHSVGLPFHGDPRRRPLGLRQELACRVPSRPFVQAPEPTPELLELARKAVTRKDEPIDIDAAVESVLDTDLGGE